jgi:AraC-like DNA-binding protein
MKDLIYIDSISQLHDLLYLEKPLHPLISVRFHSANRQRSDLLGKRFVLGFYNIGFKSGMKGSFEYGRNSCDFQEGAMVFTSPGQVLTPGEKEYDDKLVDGWTSNFHSDLSRKSKLGKNIDHYTFFSYDVTEALHVSEKEKRTLRNIVSALKEEIALNVDKYSQKLIVSNIELMLDYCTRYYDRQFYTRTNLNQDYVSKFERLIKDYYNAGKALETGIPNVGYFADKLNLSANYLGDLLRKETGKNTIEHIHLYIVKVAKQQLLNSNEAISQIAYDLGFEYPQHFSKLFKAKTGMSPANYRNTN